MDLKHRFYGRRWFQILTDERYKLFNGDAIEVMDDLIKRGIKVNSVICDIPYGTTSCSWDEVIQFDEMWDRIRKITYDNSPVVLFSSQPFTTKLIDSNINNFRDGGFTNGT